MSRPDLAADCARCAALCCVVTHFDASDEFAHTKRAGERCRHLDGNACSIHDGLAAGGYAGCVAYTCYGAGQRASRLDEPLRAFAALKDVHEMLLLTTHALDLVRAHDALVAADVAAVVVALARCGDTIERGDGGDDVGAIRRRVREVLLRVGVAVGGRAELRRRRRSLPVLPS